MAKYDHAIIEKRWQERWRQSDAHRAVDGDTRKKFYALVEFPFLSGDGLHVGHLRSYTAMDVIVRKRRMEGWNVLYPMGWDAFGLPTENYAVKTGQHPVVTTEQNIANFRRQITAMGFSFDWSREVSTADPAYYKWTQWIFLKLLEHGLAYKARVPINWCPACKIGLANEEAVGGVCDRCGGPVEQREKEQWMLRITKYADKLLAGLDAVDYIERAKTQQRNWIGRSEGALIKFQITSTKHQTNSKNQIPNSKQNITVFTTRPDTLFGAMYVVLSPEHPSISNFKSQISNWSEVEAYIAQARTKKEIERAAEDREKTGVELTGVKAVNPANNEEIPVWIADYVLGSYGTGAIMAVPAHDERDFAFAWKYGLPVRQVIRAPESIYLVIEKSLSGDDVQQLSVFGTVMVERKTENWGKFFRVRVPAEREEEFIAFLERALLLVANDVGGGWYADSIGTSNIAVFNGAHFSVWQPDELETYKVYGRRMSIPEPQLDIVSRAYTGDGTLMNSGAFDGMPSEDAKRAITEKVGGKMTVTYKLRDWVFSRQRYWGEPIPVVFCKRCASDRRGGAASPPAETRGGATGVPASANAGGDAAPPLRQTPMNMILDGIFHAIVPVPESQLPVTLPEVEKYQPTDTGESPLANIVEWVNTICPRCGGPAKRETDVMPNWAGSSWYFLAYLMRGSDASQQSQKHSHILKNVGMFSAMPFPIDDYQAALRYWLPVDWYNGGMEHTTLHLLYSRFWNLFLHDIGAVPVAEPYAKRTSHGMILAEDGEKMSKSRGNVVNPDAIVAQYGADAVRVYEMFIGPFDQAVPWSTNGLVGCRRFLEKVAGLVGRVESRDRRGDPAWSPVRTGGDAAPPLRQAPCQSQDPLIHRTIKKVTEDSEGMRFNTAISAMMECVNALGKRERIAFFDYMTLLVLLAPFAPHVCEELHAQLERSGGAPSPPVRTGDHGGSPLQQAHSIFAHPWPEYNPELIAEEEVDLVVQVNGKVRATMHVAADITEADATTRALAEPNVARHLGGKQPTTVIFVAGKILNLVCE